MTRTVDVVAVIGTGGTIAEGAAPALRPPAVRPPARAHARAGDILDGIAVPAGVTVRAVDLLDLPSTAIGLPEMAKLIGEVKAQLAAGACAVVVTHGTDTLEETAYCIDLCHAEERPVVFTAAMRPAGLPGADGPSNLQDGLAVACHRDARAMGALVVMAGAIHAAQDVRKLHSTSLTAFGSGERGLLGRVEEGRVAFARTPKRSRPLAPPTLDARVEGVKCYAGMDDVLIRAAVSGGAQALVIEAMGSGQVPPSLMSALRDATAAGIVVVVASRCGEGPLLRDHYGLAFRAAGDERDLRDAGALFCDLPGTKARIKTIVGLSAGLSRRDLETWL